MKKLDEGLSLDKHMCDYLLNVFLLSMIVSFLFSRFRKIAKATIRSVMFVCPSVRLSAWKNLAHTEHIFIKFDI